LNYNYGHKATTKYARRKSKTYGEKGARICEAEECSTPLSIYNENINCFNHTDAKIPRVRGMELKDK